MPSAATTSTGEFTLDNPTQGEEGGCETVLGCVARARIRDCTDNPNFGAVQIVHLSLFVLSTPQIMCLPLFGNSRKRSSGGQDRQWILLVVLILLPMAASFTSVSITNVRISRSSGATNASWNSELLALTQTTPTVRNRDRPPPRPFIIERIEDCPYENIYQDIADMCIDVFFKEQLNARPEDRIPPWKDAQIAYLKTLQTGDLRRRRDRHATSNEMFLAFAAEPALVESIDKPLIMNNGEILNLPDYVAEQPFVRGELLGFVEITQRPYGLGEGRNLGSDRLRPILTNLAVSRRARTLGIGSKLLDRCERHVAGTWKMNEIVLEVEDYNTQALDFYTKRGYEIMYSDPASRRFDVSGLVLRKIRCTRQILRKDLTWQIAQMAGAEVAGRSWFAQFVPGSGRFYYK